MKRARFNTSPKGMIAWYEMHVDISNIKTALLNQADSDLVMKYQSHENVSLSIQCIN